MKNSKLIKKIDDDFQSMLSSFKLNSRRQKENMANLDKEFTEREDKFRKMYKAIKNKSQ
ncbi:hypothetical protein [Enterococcus faecalis]|uniref:hypothetical protein n=1 Tax=Enterococcus faecalis TaxID=1351 RepID=UPI003D11F2BD